jgi:hypothetical protein
MSGYAVADVEPDSASSCRQNFGRDVAGIIDDAVGWRREHVSDDVAAFQQA